MAVTSTSISFIILTVGLSLFGWRFLSAYRKLSAQPEHKKICLLLALQFIALTVQNGVMGLGLLFFADNPAALSDVVVASNALIIFPAAIGIYAAYHIFSPHARPHFLLSAVGIVYAISLGSTFVNPPTPHLTPTGGIDLAMNLPLSIAIFYLLLASIGSNSYIFTRLFLVTKKYNEVKVLSGLLALASITGVINVFVRLVLLYWSSSTERTNSFDFWLGIIGGILILILAILPFVRRSGSIK